MTLLTMPLGDALTDARPGFASGDDLDDGLFQVRMNNISRAGDLVLDKRRRVSADHKQVPKSLLKPGDVLFNATNSPDLVGKTAYFPGLEEPAVFSNHFVRLRPDADLLDSRYLTRWLQREYERGYFKARCKQWVNQATFGKDWLLKMPIPLPPIAEQRRIAAVLDAADALRAKRRQAIAKLDSLTQAIFIDMFGHPGTGRHPMVPLEDLVRTGITRGIDQPGPHTAGGVPYIKTTDFGNGTPSSSQLTRAASDVAQKFPRSVVEAGDTVICIRATVGPTLLVNDDLAGANLSRGTARVAPSGDLIPEFLFEAMRTDHFRHQIQRQLRGATFLQIPLGELKKLVVPLPPLAEQRTLASNRESAHQLAASGEMQRAQVDQLFASLQQRAFRGDL